MAIDKGKYIAKYIDEGLENIAKVEGLLFDIKDGISIDDDLATTMRALHTLKGSSRMLEFSRIETLSHALESVFTAIKEQRTALSENAMKLILASLDTLKSALGHVQRTNNDEVDIQEYVKKLEALAANDEFTLPEITPADKAISDDTVSKDEKPEVIESPQKNARSEEAKSESIRLSLDKINGIIKSIATLQSLEISAKTISMDLITLNSLIREFSKTLKTDKSLDPALAAGYRKIERLSEKVNSILKNYAIDAGNHIRSAYDSVISLRTLPISTILDGYNRHVFQLADELGKKVHLTIEGKENEIDKNIIEALSEVFMHMVRNAVDHGIETPQERISLGKNETGELSIICSRESGNMKIVISDDGKGIDHEKIRAKAVREALVTEAAAAGLSKEDLTNLIFNTGFSTSSGITGVSGRGVGMDVVRKSIENMKGSIVVESAFGKGTAFTIMVPLSIAALMGFPIECGRMKFIIPANFVDTIMLINRSDIITVVDRPEIKYNNRIIKLYYLSQILQITDKAGRNTAGGAASGTDTVFVVIVRAYDDVIALAVENISSMRSVILKTMPSFMENMSVFSGIVLNENYEMVSTLHIPTVIKMAKRIKTIELKKRDSETEKHKKSILVVDDSQPTREIEKEILESEGYFVDMAADGSEALKAAKNKHYDLICTDLNMPIMDGFMLTENIRKNEELSNIPVIVISSMSSEENQKRAAMLGASRFIVKNSFNNHNLLEAVNSLIGGNNE
jgi:chemotaxis protein histidine kinase CheA/CheY-like chemotaxis protein